MNYVSLLTYETAAVLLNLVLCFSLASLLQHLDRPFRLSVAF